MRRCLLSAAQGEAALPSPATAAWSPAGKMRTAVPAELETRVLAPVADVLRLLPDRDGPSEDGVLPWYRPAGTCHWNGCRLMTSCCRWSGPPPSRQAACLSWQLAPMVLIIGDYGEYLGFIPALAPRAAHPPATQQRPCRLEAAPCACRCAPPMLCCSSGALALRLWARSAARARAGSAGGTQLPVSLFLTRFLLRRDGLSRLTQRRMPAGSARGASQPPCCRS